MDFSIRMASIDDASCIARVHVDTWRETYSGIVPSSYLEQLNYESREQRWRTIFAESGVIDKTIVAFDPNGAIAGFASIGAGRDFGLEHAGEIFAIYVYKRHHGLGVGRKLLQDSFDLLSAAGFHEFYLWVLKANPARAFYLQMGGTESEEKTIDIAGTPLKEIRMDWRSKGP